MSIEIKESSTQDTAYDKFIKFTYEGQEYSVFLHWDSYEGYDMNFTELENTGKWISDPKWAEVWEDSESKSLACILDELTDEREGE
jgi:translation elongation factor P/translation initiation factor 5A